MLPFLKRIQSNMPNVPLAYSRVSQCMIDIFHTLDTLVRYATVWQGHILVINTPNSLPGKEKVQGQPGNLHDQLSKTFTSVTGQKSFQYYLTKLWNEIPTNSNYMRNYISNWMLCSSEAKSYCWFIYFLYFCSFYIFILWPHLNTTFI